MSKRRPCDSATAFKEELNRIAPFRDRGQPLAALCLSGGGVRSAAFSIGVLQAFAERRLIRCLDYISAVSGGGYALGWWIALLQRAFAEETRRPPLNDKAYIRSLEKAQAGISSSSKSPTSLGGASESFVCSYVRSHGNYLTLRTGMLSADIWAVALTLVRNLLYGLLGPGLSLVIISLLLIGTVQSTETNIQAVLPWLYIIGAALLAMGWYLTNYHLVREEHGHASTCELIAFEIPLATGLLLISTALMAPIDPATSLHGSFERFRQCSLLFLLLTNLGLCAYAVCRSKQQLQSFAMSNIFGTALLVGATVIVVISDYWTKGIFAIGSWLAPSKLNAATSLIITNPWLPWLAIVVSQSWVAASFADVSGKSRTGTSSYHDLVRQAFTTIIGLAVIVSVLIVFAARVLPVLTHILGQVSVGGTVLKGAILSIFLALSGILLNALFSVAQGAQRIWIARELWSRWSARFLLSCITGAVASGLISFLAPGSRLSAQVTGVIAIICLALTMIPTRNYISHLIMRGTGFAAVTCTITTAILLAIRIVDWSDSHLIFGLPLAPVALIFLWHGVVTRSGPNTFSMHELYKNRLVRAFLGASNPSGEVMPYTDFCQKDDIPLSQITVPRPIPIWSAAVNVTDSSQIGLQERKAASFSFTPLRCGFEIATADRRESPTFADPSVAKVDSAYAETWWHGTSYGRTNQEYEKEDLTVGMAMATSGAAFSSNTGASTKPEKALLLTLLGFRLGIWVPNPLLPKPRYVRGLPSPWCLGIPTFISKPARRSIWQQWKDRLRSNFDTLILKEAWSRCDISNDAVYVTDGGHFENLGVYEMIRRKISLIVVVDAVCDPKYQFTDLLNLQSKARSDFGTEIRITNLQNLSPDPTTKQAASHIASWDIFYGPDDDGKSVPPGKLLYCKSTLTGTEDEDLKAYKTRNPSFPHLSTVNQWFAESTFEAYRSLGLHIGREAANEFDRYLSA